MWVLNIKTTDSSRSHVYVSNALVPNLHSRGMEKTGKHLLCFLTNFVPYNISLKKGNKDICVYFNGKCVLFLFLSLCFPHSSCLPLLLDGGVENLKVSQLGVCPKGKPKHLGDQINHCLHFCPSSLSLFPSQSPLSRSVSLCLSLCLTHSVYACFLFCPWPFSDLLSLSCMIWWSLPRTPCWIGN